MAKKKRGKKCDKQIRQETGLIRGRVKSSFSLNKTSFCVGGGKSRRSTAVSYSFEAYLLVSPGLNELSIILSRVKPRSLGLLVY